jgi:hypothetical protein
MEGCSGIEYKRSVNKSPKYIVERGKFKFGNYNKAIENVNMLDALNPLGKKYPVWFNNIRLKEWEAFQAGNDKVFIFGAIYNAKLSSIVCLMIYDRVRNLSIRIRKFTLPRKTSIGKGMLDSQTSYISNNFLMKIKNRVKEENIEIQCTIHDYRSVPYLNLKLLAHHSTEPMVTCMPLGENRAIYSHKNFMPMEGFLCIDEEKIVFNTLDSRMIIDDHKGFYPYKLEYDWVTGWGMSDDGSVIGFNLTDNQVTDKENYNENCLWHEGKVHPLPPVKVERIYIPKEVWYIKDNYEKVNIVFYPEEKMEIKFNYILIYSDYEAPIGAFEGFFISDNKKIELVECFGMGEKKKYRF